MNSPRNNERSKPLEAETTLVTAGRDTEAQKGFVKPPVVHGSTVLYPPADDRHAHRGEFQYGRHGTPTTRALQEALMALESPQCAGVGLAPSGLSAITTTLLAVLNAGDHLLVCDNAYRPSRNFCNGLLARYGVETTYFDPLIGAGIAGLFKPNTRAVLVEAPGSQSFEMGDRALSTLAGSRRRYQHAGGNQICRRTFRYHVRNNFGQRRGLAEDIRGDPAAWRVRRSRRRVSGAARPAHACGAAGAAPSIR